MASTSKDVKPLTRILADVPMDACDCSTVSDAANRDDRGDRAEGACAQAASAAHYRKMYDRVSALAKIGVWECDLATNALTWTDGVYDLFDIPRGTTIGREQSLECYEPSCRREMETLRNRAIETGIGFVLDVLIHTALGNSRWIRLTVDVEQKDGKSVHIFGTKQDISTERAAQARVRSLQTELIHISRSSAMSAMSSTLAHEVSQPLTAIAVYMAAARRMATRTTVPPELTECIEGAQEASVRAGAIIRRVREMSAKGSSPKTELKLEQLLKEAVDLVLADRPGTTVTYRLAPDTPIVLDRIQIQHVLINLLQNAVESVAGRPCQIEIATSQTETHLKISVSDAGPGIPPETLPKIFDAFVTTKTDALGVGLSISRTIVEAHGGHIEAVNLPRGGASLCFTLPLTHKG